MLHDDTKVLLGGTASNIKDVSEYSVDPEDFPAGTAVRAAADGGLQTDDDSTACLVGISLGKSLSNDARTAVARNGLRIPLIVKEYFASGTITFDDYADLLSDADTIEVAGVVFTAQSGAVSLGEAKFRAATSNELTAKSLAAQINAHEESGALVEAVAAEIESDWVVTVTAKLPGTGGNALTFDYTDNAAEGNSVAVTLDPSEGTLAGGAVAPVHGKQVYVNDDGYGCLSTDGDAAATGAVYNGGLKTGVREDGTTLSVALVDAMGSL